MNQLFLSSKPRRSLAGLGRTVAQAGALVLTWMIVEQVVSALAVPLPAGIVGLVAVLGLLFCGALKVESIKGGADLMLNELTLFFIPSVVAIVKYAQLFKSEGLQLISAVVLGTILVMVGTALAVHGGCSLERWLARRLAQRSADKLAGRARARCAAALANDERSA